MIDPMFVTIEVQEPQMQQIGKKIAQACKNGSVIYLLGTLGMGKTTLSREIVQSLGWSGKVKSPTYTLVEAYDTEQASVLHFDLYRLSDPEELEFMGIRDFDPLKQLWLIEWPEKGIGMLPLADLEITLSNSDKVDSRNIKLSAISARGQQQLDVIETNMELKS